MKNKENAAKHMINALYECGYIDDREKTALEYKLRIGELQVFENIRAYLEKVIRDITKT